MPGFQDKLRPSLNAKFRAVIWKIEVDETEPVIALETRDKEGRTAAFSTFNYESGQCYFRDKSLEDSWLWSLDKVHQHSLYLHGYKTESSPEHRGIIALDVKTGEIKWQRFDYALRYISDQGLVVCNSLIELPEPQVISPETGQLINDILPGTGIKQHISFPEIYNDLLSLPGFIPENAVGPLLHLKHKDKNCWSFHIKNSEGYIQKLIISRNNEIILSDNLASGIQKLNPEAFFIHKSSLFFIRGNNCEIVSYLL